jgi:gliding motility-associated transport system ATP-binding protein
MIDVQSLSRHYGKVTAVDNVSFQIGDNEIVGLLGHNGAGKSTIMKMLSGYLEPHTGSIRIAGIDMAQQAHAIQQQLGYLPENLPVYPDMMVADYLDYVATLKGISARDRMPAVRAAIAATDLHTRALDTINTLSRGLKQRVGVAQAILGKPRLLILDEPTNGLDPQQTEQMRALIKTLAENATVILSTHIMQEVEALCDRVLMLGSGRLLLDERLVQLRQSKSLLLVTDHRVEALETVLIRVPQVAQIANNETGGERQEYAITLHEHTDSERAAGNIAHCVIESGARLYQLKPLIRDLDTIFREANLLEGDDE